MSTAPAGWRATEVPSPSQVQAVEAALTGLAD